MDREIISLIALAQWGSDAGKDIHDQRLHDAMKNCGIKFGIKDSNGNRLSGYAMKDYCIHNAIVMICRARPSGIRVFVTEDNEGAAKYIVYFAIKDNGKSHQVSFHSFDSRLASLVGKAGTTRWVGARRTGRKARTEFTDSRETIIKLLST